MNPQKNNQSTFFSKTLLAALFVAAIFSFAKTSPVSAAVTQQIKGTNQTQTPGSTSYVSSVAANPGDTMRWRITYLGGSGGPQASSFKVILPVDLTYINASVAVSTGTTTIASLSGNELTLTLATATLNEVLTFDTTVAPSGSLSSTHTLSLPLYVNGADTLQTATLYTGAVITSVSPTNGANSAPTPFTVVGHGFTTVSQILSVKMSDNTTLDISNIAVTSVGGGNYSISGTGFNIPSGKTAGVYDIILNTRRNESGTNYDFTATSTAAYTVGTVSHPTLSAGANSYAHSTGRLTLNFSETIDVSLTDPTKVQLANHATAGSAINLSNATVTTVVDDTQVVITLSQSDINTVSSWSSAGTLYVRLLAAGFYSMNGGDLLLQSSRTALETWTKDTTAPTVTYTADQNSNTSGNVKAGNVVLTAAFNEPINTAPKIAINQPGTTDIAATDMTSAGGNTYSYTYTVQAATGSTYIDGNATVTISLGADYAGNVMTSDAHTLAIDTVKPSLSSFAIAQGANVAGTVKDGVATITVVLSEPVTVAPKIAINQPGTTDIAATDMTFSSGSTYTYAYTVHPGTDSGYSDGTAAVTISNAADSFGNVMDANTTHSFIINTQTPIVSNYTITQGANTSGYVKAGMVTISITMSEAVATVPKIAINQPGTTDIAATDMTLLSGNTYTYGYTVQSPADGTYVDGTAQVTISAAATSLGNTMLDSAHTFVIDNVKPTVSLTSITQTGNSSGTMKAGDVFIIFTANETLSVVPKISIDQSGTTDISATDMALTSGNIYNYTYTVNNATSTTYIDGTATTTISLAADRAGNVMDVNSANTFVIDTTAPTPAISDLAAPTSTPTEIALTWTPTYTAGDFSIYKIYYRANSSVDSSTGTLVSVSGSATTGSTVSGLTSGTNYFLVIYICDQAGNCSAPSNEVSRATASTAAVVITNYGGGGGGGGGSSTPSTASSAGTITSTGGAVTTTVSGGTSATVTVPASSFAANSTLSVSEATSAEKVSAPIASNAGVIIPNTIFNIQSSATFSQPVTLEFVYDPTQLGSIDPNTLSISFFSTTENKWISLPSSVNTATHKVSAQTTHFTLFAITTVPTISGSTTTNTTPTTTTPPSTPPADNGQVLGSSVGVYPNGTLLKAPNSSVVWYIANDQKHAIPSPAIFSSRFNWGDIIRLPSSLQLDLYEQGEDVKFAVNTLVKETGNSTVYRVSATLGLQPILSMDVFLKRFYRTSDIVEVEQNVLASYPREAYITDPSYIYSGELVAMPQKGVLAPVYYIDGGQARGFSTRDIFDSHALKLKRIRAITAAELKTFTIAKPMTYPDGTLLKGSRSAVYIISNGKKQAFYSGADLDALLYNRKRIRYVSDAFLAQIANASYIRLVQTDIHAASAK